MQSEVSVIENKVFLVITRLGVTSILLAFLLHFSSLGSPGSVAGLFVLGLLLSAVFPIYAATTIYLQHINKPLLALVVICLIYIGDIVFDGCSRHLVVMVFGLPSSDYQYTCLILKSLYLSFFLIAFYSCLSAKYLIDDRHSFNKFKRSSWDMTKIYLSTIFVKQYSTAVVLLTIWFITPFTHLNDLQRELILLLSHYSDYETIYRFPGVRPNERIKLHANGVVSLLTFESGKFQITVLKDDEFKLRTLAK